MTQNRYGMQHNNSNAIRENESSWQLAGKKGRRNKESGAPGAGPDPSKTGKSELSSSNPDAATKKDVRQGYHGSSNGQSVDIKHQRLATQWNIGDAVSETEELARRATDEAGLVRLLRNWAGQVRDGNRRGTKDRSPQAPNSFTQVLLEGKALEETINQCMFPTVKESALQELKTLFELLLPGPTCEKAHELLSLVRRLGGALADQLELKHMAMDSVAEVMCVLRNAAQRKEDWLHSFQDIEDKFTLQREQVYKLTSQSAEVTLTERLRNSSDLVKLASRKLEMLVGASSALGLQGHLPTKADQSQRFIDVLQENVHIAQREAEMFKVSERDREKMASVALKECESLTAQSKQLDERLQSLSSEGELLRAKHDDTVSRVQQAMDALKLAQSEEAAAAAAKAAHTDKIATVTTQLEGLRVRKSAASTKLRALTSTSGDGSMRVLRAAQEQAEIATGLGELLKSTRCLITAETKDRQSTIASAANVVPRQLLDSLVHHLQNKVLQQSDVLERVIFCHKRLARLEQERVQLEMIGMKDELKLNQTTMQKLSSMLEEALTVSDEINEVATAAKKTRDMHAAAADNGVVKTLDLLVAEIHMKHSQIFIADSSSTATGPSSSVQKLSETNGKVRDNRASKMSKMSAPTEVKGSTNAKKKGRNGHLQLPQTTTLMTSPPPISAKVDELIPSSQAPRGWGTVNLGRADANKDAEPTPAEAARRKLENFSLFSSSKV